MHRAVKLGLLGLGGLLGAAVLGVAGYVGYQVRAFDASMAKVHDVPLPAITASRAPEVVARGSHLAHSLGGCAAGECHGSDFSGGHPLDLGPVGAIAGPNITPAGMLATYSDGELARLIRTGVKKDGRSVRMMPVQDFSWLPDADVTALVSYLRTVAPSEKPNGATHVGLLGKVLDRQGKFPWDIARFVAQIPREDAPPPAPTRDYGRFVVRLCSGCHGEGLSGGPLPGAPPSLPVPLNLTPDDTGIKDYTYDDFVKVLKTGVRKNGATLNPFMSVELTRNLDDVELHALWAELRSLPPRPFGGR